MSNNRAQASAASDGWRQDGKLEGAWGSNLAWG